MYKITRSTDNGLDELEIDRLEKGCWIDVVAPSEEELQEIAAATKIQMDFLTAPLDEEEKSRIEIEDGNMLPSHTFLTYEISFKIRKNFFLFIYIRRFLQGRVS
mgnify:CR=1 FL=1